MNKFGIKLNILFGQKISDDYGDKCIKIKNNFDENLCLEKTYFLMRKINTFLKCFPQEYLYKYTKCFEIIIIN